MNTTEIILNEIGLRLTNIKITNGYHFDIINIKRAALTPFQTEDLPVINYFPVQDIQVSRDFGRETRELQVTIEAYTVTQDEPFTDVAFRLADDIMMVIYRSSAAPNTADQVSTSLGGLVNSIDLISVIPLINESEAPWCGVVLDMRFKYNITPGDFSTIINY